VTDAKVELTFDPPWSTELMTEEAKIELESMGIDPDRAKDTIGSRFAPLTIGRRTGEKDKRGR
jgi:metal-sulfur cluster biosynthetic enzyme